MSRPGAAIPLDGDAGVKTAEEMAYDRLHPEREMEAGRPGQAIPLGGRNYASPEPESVQKFRHLLQAGQRVVVRETGHHGKITRLGENARVYVELDSGHFIACGQHEELIPEDFPAAHDGEKVRKSRQAIPFDEAPSMSKSGIRLGHFCLWRGRRCRPTRFSDDGKMVHIMLLAADETDPGIDVPIEDLVPDSADSFSLDGELYATDADGNRKVLKAAGAQVLKSGDTVLYLPTQTVGRILKMEEHGLCVVNLSDGVTAYCRLDSLEPSDGTPGSARFAVGDNVREKQGDRRIGKVSEIRRSGIVEVILPGAIELHCLASALEPLASEAAMHKASNPGAAIPL